MIDGFNQSQPLKVEGTITHSSLNNGNPVQYCYKYVPWSGERPEGLPQFVTCDFEMRTTILVSDVVRFNEDVSLEIKNEKDKDKDHA